MSWFDRLDRVGQALVAAGLIRAHELPLHVEKAWPWRASGVLMTARSRSGAWCALAASDERPPRALRKGVASGRVRHLDTVGFQAWCRAEDPALAELPSPGEVLGYKPLCRRVMRHAQPDGPVWIVKQYGGERGERAMECYAGLQGEDSGPYCIPRPAAYDPPGRALRWLEAGGEPLLRRLATHPESRLMRLAAGMLAHLQARPVAWTRVHGRDEELAVLRRWVEFGCRLDPGCAPRLQRALVALHEHCRRLPAARLVPAHRDFYDKQILVDAERCTLLDLDTACLAEPELDVANFLEHLELREVQRAIGGAQARAQDFIREYLALGGHPDPQRLEFYTACTRLRLACVYLARPRWRGVAERLLDSLATPIEASLSEVFA